MKLEEIVKSSKGILLNPEIPLPETFHKIKTDTREIENGDVFIALKGQTYDGHQYIEEAIHKGAIAIITEKEIEASVPIIKVEDTYQCLFDIGTLYLDTYQPTVIAVTGSVGKTTTKELISSFLETKYHVLKSHGNKNNRIGIPQTLFELNESIECLVVELGMNHFHEIEKLSLLVKPDIAVITNIGSSHIGNLGSKRNIRKAKMEITAGLDGGILLLNGHDKYLKRIKKIKQGKVEHVYKDKGNIQIELFNQSIYGSEIQISDGIKKEVVTFSNPGLEVIEDIQLALKVGELLNVPPEEMMHTLKGQEFQTHFLVEPLENGNILVNDCYNSSYESLKMDFQVLRKMKEHKVLILGDILELGSKSKKIHRKVKRLLRKMKNTDIYLIGTEMKYAKSKNAKHFHNKEEFLQEWNSKPKPRNSIILLKGSRKMKLEKLIAKI